MEDVMNKFLHRGGILYVCPCGKVWKQGQWLPFLAEWQDQAKKENCKIEERFCDKCNSEDYFLGYA